MQFSNQKTLLFIEPCLSSHLLVLKAKEKRHTAFVISAQSDQQTLSEETIDASSILFYVNTNNDRAVLDIVKKIAQKFHIDGVIPGGERYIPLASKVAAYLNKPGISPEAALRVSRKDLTREALKADGVPIPSYARVDTKEDLQKILKEIGFPCVLKSVDGGDSINVKKVQTLKDALLAFEAITTHEGVDPAWGNRPLQRCVLIEEYIQGKEYSIEGFSKNHMVSIVSITEKFLSEELDFREVGRIVPLELEPDLLASIEPYLKKVISSLNLNYGPFHATIRLSKRGPILISIRMSLGERHTSKLIGYATGIDYCDNILKLFSSQALSFQRTQRLNAGITFFYNPVVKNIRLPKYLESVENKLYVKETSAYYKEDNENAPLLAGKRKLGHAILLHENYEVLKKEMAKVEENALFY